MKKLLCVALVVVMVLALAACAKTTNCELCGKEKKCTKVEVGDDKVWLCESCEENYEKLKEAGKDFKDGINSFKDGLSGLLGGKD